MIWEDLSHSLQSKIDNEITILMMNPDISSEELENYLMNNNNEN